jgi:hypothetical protein
VRPARRLFCSILVAALAVSCSKKEPERDTRRDPWLATPPDAQAPGASLRTKYAIDPRCEVRVELPAHDATPRGTFRVCKGELDLNLSDLAQSRGALSIDLGSIEMRGEADAGRSDDYTQRAQNWLDIGASRPEAERERLRWATFTLTSAADLSNEAAHAGKLVRDEPRANAKSQNAEAPAETQADPDSDAGKDRSESRAVSLTVNGDLLLHGVRVELSAPIRVVFHYPDRATADRAPDRLRIETHRPIPITLKLHDIKPRSPAGTLISEDMKLFGSKVGPDAKLTFSIGATPKPAP